MALPPQSPLILGSLYVWNAEYTTVPSLAHTVVRVMVTGVDMRRPDNPWVCYAIQGEPVLLSCTSNTHFRASCTKDPGPHWLTDDERTRLLQETDAAISAAALPGIYRFLEHPLAHAAHAAALEQ